MPTQVTTELKLKSRRCISKLSGHKFSGIELKVEGFTSSVKSLLEKLTEFIHKIQISKGDFELA